MKIQSKELQDFIQGVLSAITEGLKHHQDYKVDGSIKFNLAVVNKRERGGIIKIYVASANTKYNKEEVSKLEFRIRPRSK